MEILIYLFPILLLLGMIFIYDMLRVIKHRLEQQIEQNEQMIQLLTQKKQE